jgi:carbon storage regulator
VLAVPADAGLPADRAENRQGGGVMLVLTRKSNQSIMIGDDIEVSVLSIMGEKVRIGIQAPRDIPVFRKEVYLEIQQENVAAGASARAEVDDALKRLSTQKSS